MAGGTEAVGQSLNSSVTVPRSSKEKASAARAADQKVRSQSFWAIAVHDGLSAFGGVPQPFNDIAETIAAMTQRK